MATRTSLSKERLDDPDEIYRIACATPWPCATRKCTVSPKNYVELDSESEEDHEEVGNFPRGTAAKNYVRTQHNKKRKMDNDTEDVIIDERRSTPIPRARGLLLHKTQPKIRSKIVRIALSKSVQQKLRAGRLFKTLPLEIHQLIIGYLPKDRDVGAYARVCKIASASVASIIWRQRYAYTFDMPDCPNTDQMAKEYMILRGISKKWSCFDELKLRGQSPRNLMEEQRINRPLCLSMLKALIINSNARRSLDGHGNKAIIGLNHDYIRKVVTSDQQKNHKDDVQYIDILDAILNTDVNVFPERILSAEDEFLIQIIQLCLTYLILQRDYSTKLQHFELSQELVYAGPYNLPLFKDSWMCRLNVQLALSTVNFFRFHLKQSGGEGLLAEEYLDLPASQLPQPWLGRLKDETQPLGAHWKGAYTFMDQRDLLRFRSKAKQRGHRQNVFVDNFDRFQDINIYFDEFKFPTNAWPVSFERIFNTSPRNSTDFPPRPLRHTRYPSVNYDTYPMKSFFGTSRGQREAHFYGRMHAIPPQAGIPGFQRITFLQFFHDNGAYDPGSVWAYEGCVLPGNRIIVGRWWWLANDDTADDDIPAGPFMFWNVDESHAEPPIEKEESVEFLELMRNSGMGV